MALPVVGDVIWVRHRWLDQAKDQPPKVRPCYVLAVDEQAGTMNLVPITHTPPRGEAVKWSVAIDPATAKLAGLDSERNYVICDQTLRTKGPTTHQVGEVGRIDGQTADAIRAAYMRAMTEAPRPARPRVPRKSDNRRKDECDAVGLAGAPERRLLSAQTP